MKKLFYFVFYKSFSLTNVRNQVVNATNENSSCCGNEESSDLCCQTSSSHKNQSSCCVDQHEKSNFNSNAAESNRCSERNRLREYAYATLAALSAILISKVALKLFYSNK